MKLIVRTLAFWLFAAAPWLQAQSYATLNCEDYGTPVVAAPLYAFSVNTDKVDNIMGGTVYMDASFFPTLLASEGGYYSNCTITGGSSTLSMDYTYFTDVSVTGISPFVQSTNGQLYTTAIFTYSTLTVGGATISAKKPATAEDRAKAVAVIRSRSLVSMKPPAQ